MSIILHQQLQEQSLEHYGGENDVAQGVEYISNGEFSSGTKVRVGSELIQKRIDRVKLNLDSNKDPITPTTILNNEGEKGKKTLCCRCCVLCCGQ